MTTTVVDRNRRITTAPPKRPHRPQRTRLAAGQVVAAQIATALVLAATGHGAAVLVAAATAGCVVVVVAFVRVRRRWLHDWLFSGIRYAARRKTLPTGSTPAQLLRFVTPDIADDQDGLTDPGGLTAIFELDEPGSLGSLTAIPDPSTYLDLTPAESPPIALQLLVHEAPAPNGLLGATPATASYRQLTDGRIPGQRRAFLALRVRRPPGWTDVDLRPTIAGAARRVAKRIGPHRRVDGAAAVKVLAELAHHRPTARGYEHWAFLSVGSLCQATYTVTPGDDVARLIQRLLALPATVTTVSVILAGAGRARPIDLTVRVAAASPPQLARADEALRRVLSIEGATARRLDGDHRAGMADTLPLARSGHEGLRSLDPASRLTGREAAAPPRSARPASANAEPWPTGGSADDDRLRPEPRAYAPAPRDRPRPRRQGGRAPDPTATTTAVTSKDNAAVLDSRGAQPDPTVGSIMDRLPLGNAGIMLGVDRRGHPVVARLFRAVPTRALLVGGIAATQVVVLRSLALGARVEVHTPRPAAWDRFIRGATTPGGDLTLTTPGRPPRGGSRPEPLRPLLTVVDDGPVRETVGATWARLPDGDSLPTASTNGQTITRPVAPSGGEPWHATLFVRDHVAQDDTDLIGGSDLVILQPLQPEEATLAANALGLRDAAAWLTRIRDDMIGIVSNGSVRWALMSPTPIEVALTGRPTQPPPPGRPPIATAHHP